jgi:hypothetical protein
MADNFAVNPIKIDTASATAKSLPNGTGMMLCIQKIVWENPTTDGHNCTVQDSNSTQITKFDPAVATFNQSFDLGHKGKWYQGLIVPTLDSGNLYIYLA